MPLHAYSLIKLSPRDDSQGVEHVLREKCLNLLHTELILLHSERPKLHRVKLKRVYLQHQSLKGNNCVLFSAGVLRYKKFLL